MEGCWRNEKSPFPRAGGQRDSVFVPRNSLSGNSPRCRQKTCGQVRQVFRLVPPAPAFPGCASQWRAWGPAVSGLTAAGPLPIHTGFPFHPFGHRTVSPCLDRLGVVKGLSSGREFPAPGWRCPLNERVGRAGTGQGRPHRGTRMTFNGSLEREPRYAGLSIERRSACPRVRRMALAAGKRGVGLIRLIHKDTAAPRTPWPWGSRPCRRGV